MSGPDWTAQRYTSNASFVYSDSFVAPVLGLLAAQQGERVMDLGCGTGEVTAQLADSVAPGQLVGVDSSAEMLSGAKIQCASKRNVQLVQWDGQDLASCAALGDEFDAVFSNATLHWMKRSPASVVSGVHSLLKQGGRFVGEFGGHLNVGSVRSQLHAVLNARGYDAAALDPWYFPTPTAYTKLLVEGGFDVLSCELVPRVTPLPTGLAGWLETFAFGFLAGVKEERAAVIEEVVERCAIDCKSEEGWSVMYVRCRFVAVKR